MILNCRQRKVRKDPLKHGEAGFEPVGAEEKLADAHQRRGADDP